MVEGGGMKIGMRVSIGRDLGTVTAVDVRPNRIEIIVKMDNGATYLRPDMTKVRRVEE